MDESIFGSRALSKLTAILGRQQGWAVLPQQTSRVSAQGRGHTTDYYARRARRRHVCPCRDRLGLAYAIT